VTDYRRLESKPRKPALGFGVPPSPLNNRAVCEVVEDDTKAGAAGRGDTFFA
jgi:hypothetical protein